VIRVRANLNVVVGAAPERAGHCSGSAEVHGRSRHGQEAFCPEQQDDAQGVRHDEILSPIAERELRGSTHRGYGAIWSNYIDARLGTVRLTDIRTFELQEAMDDISSTTELKKALLFRGKTFMSAAFSEAIRN
jgi:hypothetical protein